MSFFESRKSRVTIDLSAIKENLSLVRRKANKASIMPVVKSDAYGHGLVEVSSLLVKEGIWGLGIYEVGEAALLRKKGIDCPIFLLSGLLGDDPRQTLELDLTVGVVRPTELKEINAASKAMGKISKVHLKVDTGMSRFGLEPRELLMIASERERFKNIEIEGIYSHLSSSDDPNDTENLSQIILFEDILREIKGLGLSPPYIHLANSGGIFNFRESIFNLVRPGISLYGAYSPKGEPLPPRGLLPAMRFWSKVVEVRETGPGRGLSYGHSFVTDRNMRIAIIPVGYDNGYPRALSNRAHVVINGKRCPIVGTICMKTMLVDVTELKKCQPGDDVLLIGRAEEGITITELSKAASTISYELLCLMGKLNRRDFI